MIGVLKLNRWVKLQRVEQTFHWCKPKYEKDRKSENRINKYQ